MGWFRHKEDPPYVAALADFSGAVDRLQEGDLLYLRSTWESLEGPAQKAAQREVERAIDASDRRDDAEALDVGLVRWAGADGRVVGYATWVSPPGLMMERDLRRQALPVLRDAGRAILATGLIRPETYETLIEPWASLSETPEPGGHSDTDPGSAGSEADA